MQTINGVKCRRTAKYRWWPELTEQWTSFHRRYARLSGGDAAYWYTERTNVGILSQAAWSMGLAAVEEYQAYKGILDDEKAQRNGRCDLWITDGKESLLIEAKQRYLHLRSAEIDRIARVALDNACSDAKLSAYHDGSDAIGLLFAPIYVAASSLSIDELDQELTRLPERFEGAGADILAWCFPVETRTNKGKGEKNYIPGLMLLARSAA